MLHPLGQSPSSFQVAMPKGEQALSVGWSFDGWVTGGGSKGTLKMLMVPSLVKAKRSKGDGGSDSTILKRHKAPIARVEWNHQYNDLTTSDGTSRL